MKKIKKIFFLFVLFLPVLFFPYISFNSDINNLLPNAGDEIFVKADNLIQNKFNSQMVFLISEHNEDKAIKTAKNLKNKLEETNLFAKINLDLNINIEQLKRDLKSRSLANLPINQANLFLNNTEEYFNLRIKSAINPFSGELFNLHEDLFGFARFTREDKFYEMQFIPEYSVIARQYKNKFYLLLLADLKENIDKSELANIVAEIKHNFVDIYVFSPILFSIKSEQSIKKEIKLMSFLGILLTFGFLFFAIRTWKVLFLPIPAILGIFAGLAAVDLIFNEVHIMTLAISTSLIGVLIDFPIHFLAPSIFNNWQAKDSMIKTIPAFKLSLSITAIGYFLLYFTNLNILKQTAVFSIFALFFSFLAGIYLLPSLFLNLKLKKSKFRDFCIYLSYLDMAKYYKLISLFIIILAVFSFIGVYKSSWQDDIKNWTQLDEKLVSDLKNISEVTGVFDSKNILIRAKNADVLLETSNFLAENFKDFAEVSGLHQVILPVDIQNKIKDRLLNINRDEFLSFKKLGIKDEDIEKALSLAENHVPEKIEDLLEKESFKYINNLYLGEIDNLSLALLKINKVNDLERIKKFISEYSCNKYWQLNNEFCLDFMDKKELLDSEFNKIRDRSIILKLLSFLLALILLNFFFKLKESLILILIPIFSCVFSCAILAFLNIPISLFASFGFLLSAAVGLDYIVFALKSDEKMESKIAGIFASAITTVISFGILSFCSTQVIFVFGLIVSSSVIMNLILTYFVLKIKSPNYNNFQT